MFPITVNALYKLNPIGKINPYIGGGFGYCFATRKSDSNALKNEYFSGPDYKISLNDSQTVSGIVLQFLSGISMPVYKNLRFVAEVNASWYDLKSFDPILEVSFTKPNPAWYQGSDLTQYSYEDPRKIGVFSQEFVGNLTIGLVLPF
jgi:hypothetical protein